MTTTVKSAVAPEFYLSEFAGMLAEVRWEAGLTVRALGRAIRHHHSRVVCAEQGKTQPTWQLTVEFLRRCGVSGDKLLVWSTLWDITRQAERRRKGQVRGSLQPDAEFWSEIQEQWQRAKAQLSWPDSLVTKLRMVSTKRELGLALLELGSRAGYTSVRQIADRGGVPKTTVHDWVIARRLPDAERLAALVKDLGATRDEWEEFAAALRRLSGQRCDAVHEPSARPCMLSEYHRGSHRTLRGDEWLDDGTLDGRRLHQASVRLGVHS
ncbi:helix-turn-helix transcriptional regulator [Kribbella sp. NPDC026611]|uniref:helix-turn-helix transcriptional regulator n=1 Tax=Kribbella sp. NPDC026611 TaxID=3154911 RepID=UPI0033D688DC